MLLLLLLLLEQQLTHTHTVLHHHLGSCRLAAPQPCPEDIATDDDNVLLLSPTCNTSS